MAKFGSMWYGPMTRLERLSINSFVKNGHEHHIFLYDMENAKGLPKEAIIHDANEIIPEEEVFKDIHKKDYFQFADIFRLKLLKKYDLVWVDLDTICLSPEWEDQKIILCPFQIYQKTEENFGKQTTLNNSLFYFNKNSHFLDELLSYTENFDPKTVKDPYVLSPVLFTKVFIENKNNHAQVKKYFKPYYFTYPFFYTEIYKIYYKQFKKECDVLSRRSFSVHVWRDTLKHSPNGKVALIETIPEEGSWLHEIYQKYLPFSSREDWKNL